MRDRDCWSAPRRVRDRYVFHLAAQTIVGIANRNPLSTFESNIAGTWNVLEACRRSPW
jgi:nucleoside-diphosphate-sugar epimerase